MFDLASLDSRTRSVAGVRFKVRDPRTATPMRNSVGEEVFVLLHGRNSPIFEQLQQQANDARAARAAAGIELSSEELRQERVDYVAGCTSGWNIEQLDGQPFPYSPENAKRMWADKRFSWLLNEAWAFVINEANFLPDTPAA